MNDHKKDVQTLKASFWLCVIALLCGILIPPIAYSADNQVQENIALVRKWLEIMVSDDFSQANQFLSKEYIVHVNNETIVVSPEQRAQQAYDQRQQRGQSSFHQLELFGERDKVVAIYSLKTSNEPVSLVQIFRVNDSKIEETWAQPIAKGVLWEWNADIYGDTNKQANALVLGRWYDEIYKEANWQLVPEVAGPDYIRHERNKFQITGEEYSQLLRSFFKMVGGMDFEYEVIAGTDKVAVIGKFRDRNWVQAWRVKDGKLVESWWAAAGLEKWANILGFLIVVTIFFVVINIVLWGLFYWRRWRRNRPLRFLWHFLLPLTLDLVLTWLILVFIPSLLGIPLALTLSGPHMGLVLLSCGTVVALTAIIRIMVYIAFTRRKE